MEVLTQTGRDGAKSPLAYETVRGRNIINIQKDSTAFRGIEKEISSR
jgi:hypothetical protein